MSTQVANLNIGSLAVGQGSNIPFGQALPPPTIDQQMQPAAHTTANLFVFNESGSGLRCTFPISNESFTLAAGQWRIISVPTNEQQLNFTVLYVLPNAPVSQLLADLYLAGETMDAIGVLGNSPIGVTGSVPSAVTQVIQDGQPTGTTVLETKETGSTATGSNMFILNDGRTLIDVGTHSAYFPLQINNASTNTFDDFTDWKRTDASPQEWTWGIDNTGKVYLFNRNNSRMVFKVAPLGGFGEIGTQATAGSFGVPVIVAQALRSNVAVTTNVHVLDYSVPVSGFYRVSCYVRVNNGTPNQKISVQLAYNDPDLGLVGVQMLASIEVVLTGGQGVPLYADGSNNTFGNGTYTFAPYMLNAAASTTLSCRYQDPAGTPNDTVTFVIERMA